MTIDLFGADQSSNAATFYSAGLKGRFEEGKRGDDHGLKDAQLRHPRRVDGRLVEREVPMLNALNEVLRDDYIKDSVGGIGRWNKVIEKAGIPFRLTLPHKAFNRKIGTFANAHVSPTGACRRSRLAGRRGGCHAADRAFVASLMGRVVEPGRYANWIAPPPWAEPPADGFRIRPI